MPSPCSVTLLLLAPGEVAPGLHFQWMPCSELPRQTPYIVLSALGGDVQVSAQVPGGGRGSVGAAIVTGLL